jgi:hypothetical protein
LNALTPAQTYVSEPSLTYDEERQLYIGEFYSGGMLHRVEGADRASVSYLMEGVVRDQYDEMVRNTSYWREREAARAAAAAAEQSHGRGGGSSDSHDNTPRRIEGIQVRTYHADSRHTEKLTVSKAIGWAELIHTAFNLATGNYSDLVYNALSHVVGDWFENVESIWNKQPKKKIFAVSFGGILITATSRAMLRKLLTRQRNLRIQRIMKSVRAQQKEEEDAEERRQMSLAAYRLREKKRVAKKEFWKDRVRKRDLKEIIGGMRESISDKKNMAENQVEELWARKMS